MNVLCEITPGKFIGTEIFQLKKNSGIGYHAVLISKNCPYYEVFLRNVVKCDLCP